MKITYEYGESHAPMSHAGRIVLTFDGERSAVELQQQKGFTRRSWIAILPQGTWANLVATLERYGFPREATIQEPPVPGSLSATITWDLRGPVEKVTIAGHTPDYRDVSRIAWAVVAQMAPTILRGRAEQWAFPDSRVDDARERDTA